MYSQYCISNKSMIHQNIDHIGKYSKAKVNKQKEKSLCALKSFSNNAYKEDLGKL